MAVKQADLAKLGVIFESSFLGSTTGSLFLFPGAVSLEWQTEFARRDFRTSVWRQQSEQSFCGNWFEGSIELELHACEGIAAVLRTFFTTKSIGVVPGTEEAVLRPWRNDPPTFESFRIRAEFDGHWMEFSGAVADRIRITARSRSIVRMTVEWKAARLTEYTTTPGWTWLEAPRKLATADVASVKVDTVAHGQVMEFSVEFSDPKNLTNMSRDGEFTQATRDGDQTVTGTLIEYFDSALDLPGESRAGTDVRLDLRLPVQGDATKFFSIALPAVRLQRADQVAFDPADSILNATFAALQPSALDDTDELELEYTIPI